MRLLALRQPHNLGLVVALLIVVAIGVISFLDRRASKKTVAAAEQSRLIAAQIQELLSQLKDAEAGERGFLLAGEEYYLEPYDAALPRIHRLLSQLGRPGVAFADPSDAASLPSLITDRLEELARTIAIRRQTGAAQAFVAMRASGAKRTMDRIRIAAGRALDAENLEFTRRTAAADVIANRTSLSTLSGVIVLALLLSACATQVNRLIGNRDNLILGLSEAHRREADAKAAFETTLRSIGDAVIATDGAEKIRFMNPVAESLTGWTMAAATGRPLSEVFSLFHESTGEAVQNPADKALRDDLVVGLATRTSVRSKNGREIPIEDSSAPIHDESGATAGVVVVFRDVTQRRRWQRELQESERRYRILFDSNPEVMFVYDTESLAFLLVNDAAIQNYGYSREEFLSMTLRDIRPPEDGATPEMDVRNDADARKPGDMHAEGPWRHKKKDGSIVHVEITAHPIALGSVHGCLVMAKDITKTRLLEEQLRQSQKLEAIGRLAGGIAHDFNNLLTVILGYAEMIHDDMAEDDAHRGSIQEILGASQRAASLTQQLLAFSRRQVLQPRRIRLNTNISVTQKMLARLLGEDIQIVTVLAPDLCDISADPGQIDQIILNLSLNARDAMDHGGVLTMETANFNVSGEESARYMGMAPGAYARLSITDTGRGMDDETLRQIFEPFFTTKGLGRGTGLGLSTVYGIVKQSGGHISAISELGRGTTFTVYLPCASGPDLEVPAKTVPEPVRYAVETVLVVEDDDTVRGLVSVMLTNIGYHVLTPPTPDEALRVCADSTIHIDLLLTDLVLPHTDGIAVAQQATRRRPGLKVLFMSGYTEHAALRRQAFDQGTPFLQKPFTQAMLDSKVREILRAKPEDSGAGAS